MSLQNWIKASIANDAKTSFYFRYTDGDCGNGCSSSVHIYEIRVKSTGSDTWRDCLPYNHFDLCRLSGKETEMDLFQLGLKLGRSRSQQLSELDKRDRVFDFCLRHRRTLLNTSNKLGHSSGDLDAFDMADMPEHPWMTILSETCGTQRRCCVLGNEPGIEIKKQPYLIHLGSTEGEEDVEKAFDSCVRGLEYPQNGFGAFVTGGPKGQESTVY